MPTSPSVFVPHNARRNCVVHQHPPEAKQDSHPNLEIHPLLALFTMMVGGAIGAIVGVYLSVPLVAMLRMVWRRSSRLVLRTFACRFLTRPRANFARLSRCEPNLTGEEGAPERFFQTEPHVHSSNSSTRCRSFDSEF